jgi:hypothetical protein
MLSKTEKNYLSEMLSPSHSHKRVLDHRIKKKINEFYKKEFPLIQNSSVIDFNNIVTKFSNNINENSTAESMRRPNHEGKFSSAQAERMNVIDSAPPAQQKKYL